MNLDVIDLSNNIDTTETPTKKTRKKKEEQVKETIDLDSFDLSNCSRCGLCLGRGALPQIVENCDYLFIGESPTHSDSPFSGKSGQLLDDLLVKVGIDKSKCSLVNVVQGKPPSNRQPLPTEIEACDPIVQAVIKKANPKVIIPLGATALKKFIKKGKITALNSTVNEVKDFPNIKIVPGFSPSACLREPKNTSRLEKAISVAKQLMVGEVTQVLSNVRVINDLPTFNEFITELENSKIIALDIETSGNNWLDNYIICISFATKTGHSWVLPWIMGDDAYYKFCRDNIFNGKTTRREVINNVKEFCNTYSLNHPKYLWEGTDVKSRLKAVLANKNIIKILHNFAFDYKFLEASDLKIEGKIYDTMIMHYLVDESRGTHGLKDLAKYYTQYGSYDDKLELVINKKKDTFAIIPPETLFPYAGTDSDVTLLLFHYLYPKLQSEQQETLYNTFVLNLIYLLMETEKNGAKLDQEIITNYVTLLQNKIKEVHTQIITKYGDWNYNSTKQLGNFLFEQHKLPIIEKTDKGNASVGEEVLIKLAEVHDLPKMILEIRKYQKALSVYVLGFKKAMWRDGKIHSNFMAHGTETGRLASKNPNVQNIPRFDPKSLLGVLGINLKNMICCSDPDYVLVETDYSQAELRLIAEYSRDINLYNAFLNERDPHAELAVRLYHKEYVADMEAGKVSAKELYKKGIVSKNERDKGKTANFSLCYGKFAENFAKEEGIPLEEARLIHKVYWETYPGIVAWKEKTLEEGRKNGYFKSFFGRRRRIPNINSEDDYLKGAAEREGINFVIQSQASDYTLYSTLKVMKKTKELGIGCRTISFVHDAAVYEVKKTDLQRFLTTIYEIMTKVVGMSIKMDIDVKVGHRLGECKEYHKNSEGIWEETKK